MPAPAPFPLVENFTVRHPLDLPSDLILSPRELDEGLNFRDLPSYPANALKGEGVFETLKGVSELVLKRLSAETPQ